jgi:hypothetical protein
MSSHGLLKMFMSIGCFLTNVLPGYFCPALAKAVKTMKKAEKVLLTVKPQCEFLSVSKFDYYSASFMFNSYEL